MDRRGYLVVGSNHSLFSKQACDAIEANAKLVLDAIQDQNKITLPRVGFSIRTQALGTQSPTAVISTTFPGNRHSAIRMLLVPSRVPTKILHDRFSSNDLLVVVEESKWAVGANFVGGPSLAGCRVVAEASRSARLVEDLIIDVTLGTYFRTAGAIRQLVAQEGLRSLFIRKVTFARRSRRLLGPVTAARTATYLMLSSLGSAADNKIDKRASQAFEIWKEFSDSLTVSGLPLMDGPDMAAGDFATQRRFFRRLKKIGGQLPIKRITKIVSELSGGSYVMAILRSSSTAGKSPSFKSQVAAIFGPRAKRNRFRIYPAGAFASDRATLQKLEKSEHLLLIPFVVGGK